MVEIVVGIVVGAVDAVVGAIAVVVVDDVADRTIEVTGLPAAGSALADGSDAWEHDVTIASVKIVKSA